jgi:hypothetical protein
MWHANVRNRILEIEKQVPLLEAEKMRLYAELQKGCGHETIVQGDFWSTDERCIRICTICGLEENGWYDDMDFAQGHTHLKDTVLRTVHKIPRENLARFRPLRELTTVSSKDKIPPPKPGKCPPQWAWQNIGMPSVSSGK